MILLLVENGVLDLNEKNERIRFSRSEGYPLPTNRRLHDFIIHHFAGAEATNSRPGVPSPDTTMHTFSSPGITLSLQAQYECGEQTVLIGRTETLFIPINVTKKDNLAELTAIVSENALGRIWDMPEEDEAWKDL